MTLKLGIDTGGTFTDAVILDARDQVAARAKALTTHYDLSRGIAAVLDKLPGERLAAVELVGLSTTLTTNAVVERRGMPAAEPRPSVAGRDRSGIFLDASGWDGSVDDEQRRGGIRDHFTFPSGRY